ncbi:hypothetical protein R3P38DRAFT_2771231 [Favolaschia claudopus]|uniref:Uncharacterized protein n=1 Tax=Favolaschia claudopus TaxID=2862362 RepID=A0AAW0CAJ5_9AGAR
MGDLTKSSHRLLARVSQSVRIDVDVKTEIPVSLMRLEVVYNQVGKLGKIERENRAENPERKDTCGRAVHLILLSAWIFSGFQVQCTTGFRGERSKQVLGLADLRLVWRCWQTGYGPGGLGEGIGGKRGADGLKSGVVSKGGVDVDDGEHTSHSHTPHHNHQQLSFVPDPKALPPPKSFSQIALGGRVDFTLSSTLHQRTGTNETRSRGRMSSRVEDSPAAVVRYGTKGSSWVCVCDATDAGHGRSRRAAVVKTNERNADDEDCNAEGDEENLPRSGQGVKAGGGL